MRAGLIRRHRVGVASFAVVVVAASAVVVYAMASPGYAAHEAKLNDGGVWVTNDSSGQFGRLNKPINQLDGAAYALSATDGGDTTYKIDVLQNGSAVLAVDQAKGQFYPLDPSTLKPLKDGGANLPPNGTVAIGGTSLAVMDPAKGAVKADVIDPDQPLGALTALGDSARPVAEAGAGAGLAVGQDGTVYAASPSGMLTTVRRAGAGFASPHAIQLPASGAQMLVTAVGDKPVVLAIEQGTQTATLLLPDGKRAQIVDGAEGVLQQPGPAAATVLVATPEALVTVELDTGATHYENVGDGQTPAAPVLLGGCQFSAWSGPQQSVLATSCSSADVTPVRFEPGSLELVFRVNRGQIMLNDRATGATWNIDDPTHPKQVDNWSSTRPLTAQTGSNPNTPSDGDTKPRPPKPQDDTLGARPGRVTPLYVLDNDNSPNGEILAVAGIDAPSSIRSWLSIAPDGQTIDIALPAGATTDVNFKYVVKAAKGGTASANVVVHPRQLTENADPTQRKVPKPQQWYVPQSGTITIPALSDWRDYTDGDPVVLASATAPQGSTVSTTPDGDLVVSAPPKAGDITVPYTVADGMGGKGAGSVVIHVQNLRDRAVAATAEPDIASGQVGKPIVIHPLDNDLPGSDPLSPTATLQLAGSVPSPTGTAVATDATAGTVTVVATKPGTYVLGYQAAYGNAPFAKGSIQVTVAAATTTQKPITAPDTAVLHAGMPVTVDVLSNDLDPNGDLLVVQQAKPHDATQLQVAILDGRFVRINALVPTISGTQLVDYVVTDGVSGPVTGQILVTQLPLPQNDAPAALADYATVRTGDSVAIPVLDNDIAPAGDQLTLVKDVTGAPSAGSLAVSPKTAGSAYISGRFVRFVAPPGVTTVTTATFDYVVQNSAGVTADGTVHVTITPPVSPTNPDQPPAPRSVEARVVAGQTVQIKIPTSGIDPDGDSATVTGIAAGTQLGRVMGTNATSITYQAYPNVGTGGTDEFSYVVTDTQGMSATASIRVAVVPPGDPQPPVAVDDNVTAAPDATVTVDALANDFYASDDHVAISLSGDAGAGVSLSSAAGPIVVKAAHDPGQPTVAVYKLGDGLNSSTAKVTVVSQKGVNLPPIAFDQYAPPPPAGTTSVQVPLLKGDYDPDSGNAPKVTSPASGVSGTLTVPLSSKPQVIPYVIQDGDGGLSSAAVYVPALGGGGIHLKAGASITVPAGGVKTVDVNSLVVDPANKQVRTTTTNTLTASPSAGLTVAPKGDGQLVLTAGKGYDGPAEVTFQVTDGTTLNEKGALYAYITVPVQVGDVTPVLRCPSDTLTVIEGGPQLAVDVASVCHVWMPNPASVEKLTYTASWKQQPNAVSLSGQGSAKVLLKAGGAAKPGAQGVLTVRVDGTSALPATLSVIVARAPRPIVSPIVLDGIKAGETRTKDIAQYMTSQLGDPVFTIVGTPAHASGDPATITASGSNLTVTPGKDSRGTITFTMVVSDVRDPSRSDRQIPAQVTLHVLGHPKQPTNVYPDKSVESHAVLLHWTPPADNGGVAIDYYVVSYGSGTQQCAASPCDIHGLTNAHSYTFTVKAHNAIDFGPDSAPSAPAVPDAAPLAVTGFKASQPEDGSMTLTWDKNVPDGTPLTGYDITWKGNTGPAHHSAPGDTSWTLPLHTLDNNVITTFTIIAFNHGGQYASPPATTSGQSAGKPDAPQAPTLLVTNDNRTNSRVVVLTWPAVPSNGPTPTSYTVYRKNESTSVEVSLTCADPTQPTCTDGGVQLDGTRYDYSLTAANPAAKAEPATHTSDRSPVSVMEAANTPDGITNIRTGVVASTPDGQAPVTFDLGASHGKTSQVTCASSAGSCFSNTYGVTAQSSVPATLTFPNGYSGSFTLMQCNGSSGANFAGQSCVTSAAVPISVNAPPSTPGGPSCGLSGTTVIFSWAAAQAYGARSISGYSLGNATTTTTTATSIGLNEPQNGPSGTSTLTVVAVDNKTPTGESSGVLSITCPHASPPPPAISATKSSGYMTGTIGTCTSTANHCWGLHVVVSNFQTGFFTWSCQDNSGTYFSSGTRTIHVSSSNQDFGDVNWCLNGVGGETITITINGVRSNGVPE